MEALRAARADRLCQQLRVTTSHDKWLFVADVMGGRFDGILRSLRFSLSRRMSLAFATLRGQVVAFNRWKLQQLLRGWKFALSYCKELSCCLNIAYVASCETSIIKRIKPLVVLMDELLLVTFFGR